MSACASTTFPHESLCSCHLYLAHAPAVACFQKEGITVTPFLSRRRSFAPGEWLLPDEEAFFNAYYLVRELVGYATYKVAGYV